MVKMKRLQGDEIIDEITIKIVPRFKSSEMSGDEWRTSARVTIKRKGKVIHQRGYRDIDAALKLLPALLIEGFEMGEFDLPNSGTDGLCMQPGCPEKATTTLVVKHKYYDGYQLPDEDCIPGSMKTRVFCDQHAYRGDSDYNDRDENYIVKSGIDPNKGNIPDAVISIPDTVFIDGRNIDLESPEGANELKSLLDDVVKSKKRDK